MESNQEQYITQRQLQTALGITQMTIFLWRRGNAKMPPLPCELPPRGTQKHSVRFSVAKVLQWLQAYRPQLVEKLKGSGCGTDARGEQDDLSHHPPGDAAVNGQIA